MKLKILIIGGFLILLIAISNVPKVSLSIMIMTGDNGYKKTNYHFSAGTNDEFSVWSRKGYDEVLDQFKVYKKRHPSDSTLYRNFKPDYRKFWRWREFLSEKRYEWSFRELPKDAYATTRGVALE